MLASDILETVVDPWYPFRAGERFIMALLNNWPVLLLTIIFFAFVYKFFKAAMNQ